MTTVDKSTVGTTGRQYHVGVELGEISDVVLMPGDPFRVQLIADHLEDADEIAHKREYRTVAGTYRGRGSPPAPAGWAARRPRSASRSSPGRRSPPSSGSAAPRRCSRGIEAGDLIVREGSLRNDGTTAAYVPAGYPAVPDLELTDGLTRAARRLVPRRGLRGAHGHQRDRRRLLRRDAGVDRELPPRDHQRRDGELGMFVVARLRGLRAGMVCAGSGNLVTGDVVYGRPNERLAVGWEHSIRVALETVIELGL